MEVDKKKMVIVAVAVICILLAVVITAKRLTTSEYGSTADISESEMIWVKCINPKCNTEYEMSKKAYFSAMQSGNTSVPVGAMNLIRCEKCSKDSIVKADKCEKCGHVFAQGTVPNDYQDRCPKCKYSNIEDLRNQAQ